MSIPKASPKDVPQIVPAIAHGSVDSVDDRGLRTQYHLSNLPSRLGAEFDAWEQASDEDCVVLGTSWIDEDNS